MGTDPDLFDDIFADKAVKNVRAGCKFKPKAKARPIRKESNVPPLPTSQPVRTVDSAQNDSGDPHQTKKPLEPYDGKCLESRNLLEHAANKGSMGHIISSVPESDVLIHDLHSSFEKSGEKEDIFLGLESLEEFLPHSRTVKGSSIPLSDTPAVPATQNGEDPTPSPVIDRVSDSVSMSTIADDPTCPEFSPAQDPLTCGQPIVSNDEGVSHMHVGNLESEQMGHYPYLESPDMSDITSGQRTGKLQPKPKIGIHKEGSEVSTRSPDAGETVVSQMNDHLDPSEIDFVDKGGSIEFPPEDVLELSSLGLDQSIPTESTSELLADEQLRNFTEASQAATSTLDKHTGSVPEMRGKIATRRAKSGRGKNLSASTLSPNLQNPSAPSRDNEGGRILRPRLKRTDGPQVVKESTDGQPAEEISADCPGESVTNEDDDADFQVGNEPRVNEYSDADLHVENEPQVKKQRKRRKSGTSIGDKEKPVRKRKKADAATDQVKADAPKKSSHSTRQKRRTVDKKLLETPEYEIEFRKVPLKDLIILAGYKERMAKKEAPTLEAHLNSQSADTNSRNYNEDDYFASEQGEEPDDGQESPRIQKDASYFNYQTYMDKTPRTRWSKQDTELFYVALRQFGTDLSMIQQLFPGKTRRQIKLKYKKEERQHSSRLFEALSNPAKDHSQFVQVIERLQQVAAEESSKHEYINLEGDEEADEVPETTNEEAAKSEQQEAAKSEQQHEQEEVEGLEPDISVGSPVKCNDNEEDVFDWSEYKSEI